MLLNQRLRIEITNIEILKTRTEVLLQFITSTGSEIPYFLDEASGIGCCLRKAVWADQDHAKDRQTDDLTAANIEHGAILVLARCKGYCETDSFTITQDDEVDPITDISGADSDDQLIGR